MHSIAFTLFHKDFYFLKASKKCRHAKYSQEQNLKRFLKEYVSVIIFITLYSITMGPAVKVNQKILQYARNPYSSRNKKIKSAINLLKNAFRKKKYFMKYNNLVKTSNFCNTGKSPRYILKCNAVHILNKHLHLLF